MMLAGGKRVVRFHERLVIQNSKSTILDGQCNIANNTY
jgi:hypothetical protein